MTDQHPITPLSELVELWITEVWHEGTPVRVAASDLHIATQAARWGADQELEACRKAIISQIITIDNIGLSGPAAVLHTETCSSWPAFAHMVSRQLRDARRPNPPSLKEQALETLSRISKDEYPCNYQDDKDWETIRRALEQLDD